MSNNRFTLAYAQDNQAQAEALADELSKAGITFEHLSCSDQDSDSFSYQLSGSDQHVLLLVSDNFLKSTDCLNNIYATVQNLLRANRLTPIVIDGVEKGEDGQPQYKKTEFDRVSHVIQYMNYWQDVYLQARKEKRDVAPDQEEAFNDRIKRIRAISSDIGEFLRFLRNADYLTYEQLADNQFELFFKKFNLQHLWPVYQQKAGPATTPTAQVADHQTPSLQSEPEQSPDLQSEQEQHPDLQSEQDADTPEEQTEEMPPVPIQDIPGMKQVEERSSEFRPEDDSQTPDEETTEEAEQTELDDIFRIEGEPSEEAAPLQSEDWSEDDEDDEDVEDVEDEGDHEQERHPRSRQPEEEKIERIAQSASYFVQTGEVEQGLNLLRTLLKNHPANPFIRHRLASYLLDYAKQPEEAHRQLETLLSYDPGYAPAYVRLAEIAEQEEDHLLAKNYLEKARELDAHYPEIDYRLGLLTQMHFPENREEIRHYFKRAVKADKQNVDAHYRYAMLLNEIEGKEKKAAKYFKKTLALQPRHPFANYDLALLYYQREDWEKAARYYKRAARINPELKTDKNDQAFAIHLSPEEIKRKKEAARSPFRLPQTTDQVVWITGATSGIGRATAEIFARNGYRLILSGRRSDRLEKLGEQFDQKYQSRCKLISYDVRDPNAVREAVSQLDDSWREVDLLINNAGLAKGLAPIHEGDIEHWETMIDTNIKGLLYMTRQVSPLMVERGRGHIINVCSVAGSEVYPQGNVYCATKHAVDALTRAMRLDLYEHGLRVSQVSPGHVEETEFALVRYDGDAEKARIYEDFRPLSSEDVAETIFFIATRPPHVNIQDVLMFGSQQASANHIDRSGRGEG